MKNKVYQIILFACLTTLFLLQIHNIQNYPVTKGFDARSHAAYINYLQEKHKVPLPNEGWELYQPPLYYFLGSLLPISTQWIGLLSWIGLVLAAYQLFKDRFDNLLSLIGIVLVASLPVVISVLPQISNELFSGVMISICLSYYLIGFSKKKTSGLVLGVLLSLALLSKATAFVLLFCIFIDQLWENKRNIRILVDKLWFPALTIIVLAGWFYLRNLVIFGNPFVVSVDFPQFAFTQPPGYRDLSFFTDLSGFIKLDIFHAHWYSLWSGTYFSWFYDGHNNIIPVQQSSKAGIALVLFSLPLCFLFVKGYLKEIKNITSKNRVLLLYPIILFISYVIYNFKLPFYSTVKAEFLISAALPWVYFVLKGMSWQKNWQRNILVGYTLFYCLLVLKNFWILSFWYK